MDFLFLSMEIPCKLLMKIKSQLANMFRRRDRNCIKGEVIILEEVRSKGLGNVHLDSPSPVPGIYITDVILGVYLC